MFQCTLSSQSNGLVKPPRRDKRALGPAGIFGGKAPLRLAAQKSRPHAPSVPMRSAPVYYLCKWGVKNKLDKTKAPQRKNLRVRTSRSKYAARKKNRA